LFSLAANFWQWPPAVRPVFDWRQLQRWGISENSLPVGSEIRFRSPTAWEQYHRQIMLISAVLVLQSLLIGGLFYEHRRRRQAEVEASHRMAELAHMNDSALDFPSAARIDRAQLDPERRRHRLDRPELARSDRCSKSSKDRRSLYPGGIVIHAWSGDAYETPQSSFGKAPARSHRLIGARAPS
jgi:hypothetical protein